MSSQNNDSNELNRGWVEIAAAGTLATAATMLEGVGILTLGTIGGAAFTVSLPAVVAVAAAGTLGISVGSKIVSAINNSGGEADDMKRTNGAKA